MSIALQSVANNKWPDTFQSKIMKNTNVQIMLHDQWWPIVSWHLTILSADFIQATVHQNITINLYYNELCTEVNFKV